MLESTRSSLFLDYFRFPYALGDGEAGPGGWVRVRRQGADPEAPALYWPAAAPGLTPGEHRLGDVPLLGAVVPDSRSEALRSVLGGAWRPDGEIRGVDGRAVASIWREGRGSVLLPFDPDEIMRTLWSEEYQRLGGVSTAARAKRLATRAYYRARPLLPRSVQIAMRRAFSRVQARTRFPRWPVEPGLHDLYDRLLALLGSVAGEPVPYLSPWPAGKSWALVLTHDVETAVGYEHMHLLRDPELEAGCRSSWNFVPKRYAVDDAVVAELHAGGFEVGVHGLYHDGRDLESLPVLRERLPEIRAHAERWGAHGFRSPATHRRWEWMPLLGFDYDTSYPDTDPFEPQAGGCCTWLPFENEELVELPLTLPQDHTLFVILRHADERVWVEKTELLRRRGGMALLNTHPDYALEGGLAESYARFLGAFRDDPGVWQALPSEVCAWWRRRGGSRPERRNGGWAVAGPAAGEAEIRYAEPATQAAYL